MFTSLYSPEGEVVVCRCALMWVILLFWGTHLPKPQLHTCPLSGFYFCKNVMDLFTNDIHHFYVPTITKRKKYLGYKLVHWENWGWCGKNAPPVTVKQQTWIWQPLIPSDTRTLLRFILPHIKLTLDCWLSHKTGSALFLLPFWLMPQSHATENISEQKT